MMTKERRNDGTEEGRREKKREKRHLAHLTNSEKIFVRRNISTFRILAVLKKKRSPNAEKGEG